MLFLSCYCKYVAQGFFLLKLLKIITNKNEILFCIQLTLYAMTSKVLMTEMGIVTKIFQIFIKVLITFQTLKKS